MKRNPNRLAWAVLLTSFTIFVILIIALPLGIRAYILYSRVRQNVTLEVQRGPLRVTLAGRGVPVAITENRDEIPEQTVIATDTTSGQLVAHARQGDHPAVARVQVYDNTEVVLSSARSPRFSASRLPHKVALEVKVGRVRIGVFNDDGRSSIVEVDTPHGSATLTEGSYEVKVNGGKTELTVRDGQATVIASSGQTLALGLAERAIVEDARLTGPLPGARNLIANGDFQSPLETAWTVYDTQTDPQQPRAQASIVTDQGRDVVDFYRDGVNHAEVGISQEINYDVRDFSFLELHLAVRIDSQDIAGFGGCGYLSSECPIIVAMAYKDTLGSDREWRHGFYTGEPAEGWPLYPWTEKIQPGVWRTYDSGNLMEELAEAPPTEIKSLTIYASGHSFHALVTEVELLAQE